MIRRRRDTRPWQNKYYSKKRKLSNPFFPKKNKRFRLPTINLKFIPGLVKSKAIYGIVLVALSFLFWFLFINSFFSIRDLEIKGANRVSEEKVRSAIEAQKNEKFLFILPQKNIFLFGKGGAKEKLEELYAFKDIKIEKKLPKKLTIRLFEKDNDFIYLEEGKYYYCDQDGFIITEISPLNIKKNVYPIIENQSDQKIKNSKTPIRPADVSFVKNVHNELINNPYELNIEKYILNNELNTAKIKIEAGPEILLNTQEEYKSQIKRLMIIKNERLKEDFIKKSYIDLRYGDKVFIR
jgi:cell division septal protein FtsQ